MAKYFEIPKNVDIPEFIDENIDNIINEGIAFIESLQKKIGQKNSDVFGDKKYYGDYDSKLTKHRAMIIKSLTSDDNEFFFVLNFVYRPNEPEIKKNNLVNLDDTKTFDFSINLWNPKESIKDFNSLNLENFKYLNREFILDLILSQLAEIVNEKSDADFYLLEDLILKEYGEEIFNSLMEDGAFDPENRKETLRLYKSKDPILKKDI